MSNVDLIIEERAAQIGNFIVGRLLPFRQKRAVGPFVFIDHMGPVTLAAEENFDIGPHPHIGLSTLTYLFEGSIMHRDSIGSVHEIKPGAVNWMTAGKGVVHSERTPEYLRGQSNSMHGLQIWVAMPKSLEQSEPSFHHIPADDLPNWESNSVQFRLIAGHFGKYKSPVPVHSPLYMIEATCTDESFVDIGSGLFGESGLYILDGSIEIEGIKYSPRQILVTQQSSLCSFKMHQNTSVYIFGGEPFPEERFIHWNFVSSDKNLIEQAKRDWKEQRFPKIEGEQGYIPLPEYK